MELTPWTPGAHAAPAKVEEKPKRHTKPQLSRNGAEPYAQLIVAAAQPTAIEVADVVHAVTSAAGLDGEAVRDVRVLQRFSLLSVPDERGRSDHRRRSTAARSAGASCASSSHELKQDRNQDVPKAVLGMVRICR